MALYLQGGRERTACSFDPLGGDNGPKLSHLMLMPQFSVWQTTHRYDRMLTAVSYSKLVCGRVFATRMAAKMEALIGVADSVNCSWKKLAA